MSFDRNTSHFEGRIRFYEVGKIFIKKKHMSRSNRLDNKGSIRKLEVRKINVSCIRESISATPGRLGIIRWQGWEKVKVGSRKEAKLD